MIKRIQKDVMYRHENSWVKQYVIFYDLGKIIYRYKAFCPSKKEWKNFIVGKKSARIIRTDLYKLTKEDKLELL